MRRTVPLLALLAITALAACGDDDGDVATDATSSTVASVTTDPDAGDTTPTTGQPPRTFEVAPTQPTLDAPGSSGTGVPIGDDASANVTAAVADLTARLGVDESAVLLVSEENVTWRNGAIGCPEPGMAYTDALVDGVRVVLEADGAQYSYHAGGSRTIFYCEHPQLPGH